jgi:hypothetical protein
MSESIDTIIFKNPIEDIGTDIIEIKEIPGYLVPTRSQQINHQRQIRALKSRSLKVKSDIPDPSLANAPRLLNSNEIAKIMTGFPVPSGLIGKYAAQIPSYNTLKKTVYSSDPVISINVYKQLYVVFSKVLEEIILTPSAIDDFRDNLYQFIILSRAIPSTTVGNISADAMGSYLTQLTLNSFASLTGSTVSFGLDYCKELLEASPNRKQTKMIVHLRDKYLSFEKVLNLRSSFASISVGDLVNNNDILDYDELKNDYWYKIYNNIEPIKLTSKGLRLYLDVDKLYSYEVTMTEIVKAITEAQSGLLHIVPSPLFEGIIDIYPVQNLHDQFKTIEKTLTVTTSNSSIIFLCNIILQKLDSIMIKGINGITDLFAKEINLWSMIKSENKLNDNTYMLILDKKFMTINNIGTDRILRLLNYLKFQNIQIFPDRIILDMPADYLNYSKENNGKLVKLSPNKYINMKIDTEKENFDSRYKILKSEFEKSGGKLFNYPSSELYDIYYYVYAETSGSNLLEVLSLDYVDADIVLTTNIHEVKRVMGIEVARNLLIKDLYESLTSQGSAIDNRHIVFTADYLMNVGDYIGFTYTGLTYQDVSDFDRISFQRPFDVFNEKAAFGSSSTLTSASSAIFLGEQGNYGTGASILEVDNKTRAEYVNSINSIEKISVDSISDLLDELDTGSNNERMDDDIDTITNNTGSVYTKIGKIPSFPTPIAGIPTNNVDRGTVNINTNTNTNNINTNNINTSSIGGLNINTSSIGGLNINNNAGRTIPNYTIKAAPVVSNLLGQSIAKISIPVINKPLPISLPIPDSELYIPPNNTKIVEKKNTINVENQNGKVITIPIAGLTESKNAAIPIVKNNKIVITKPIEIKPKIIGIPSNIKITPIVLAGTTQKINENDFLNSLNI